MNHDKLKAPPPPPLFLATALVNCCSHVLRRIQRVESNGAENDNKSRQSKATLRTQEKLTRRYRFLVWFYFAMVQ